MEHQMNVEQISAETEVAFAEVALAELDAFSEKNEARFENLVLHPGTPNESRILNVFVGSGDKYLVQFAQLPTAGKNDKCGWTVFQSHTAYECYVSLRGPYNIYISVSGTFRSLTDALAWLNDSSQK